MLTRFRWARVAGLLGLLLALLPSAPVAAATTIGDGTPGSCNYNVVEAAINAGGTITFNCGSAPLAFYINDPLIPTQDTTIIGPVDASGAPLIAIRTFYNFSILTVNSGINLTIEHLDLAGYQDLSSKGAAINNSGTTTVRYSRFIDNYTFSLDGGAIYNAGTLTIENSTFSGNRSGSGGGAIYNHGTATVTNSVFTSNTGDVVAGAIDNSGTLTVRNSTFTDNDGGYNGGAIYNVVPGNLTVTNTTMALNHARDGGAIDSRSTAVLTNSTLVGNWAADYGGGLWIDGSFSIANSIVAGNDLSTPWSPYNHDIGGDIMSQGYNLLADTPGWGYAAGSITTGNILASNPVLGALGNNGGPTQTMAPVSGSPVIDAGNPDAPGSSGWACPTIDQRGAARPTDGNSDGTARCDIGAVEASAPPTPPSVSAPKVTLKAGGTLANPSAGVYMTNATIRWTASDADGIASQLLQVNVNGAGWTDVVPQPSVTQRSAIVKLEVGKTYQWRVQATDALGAISSLETSALMRSLAYQENNAAWSYAGTTAIINDAAAFGTATVHRLSWFDGTESGAPTATEATLAFYGARVALIARTAPDGGLCEIWLDGVYKTTLSLNSTTTRNRQVVWVANGIGKQKPGGGQHALVVKWVSGKVYIDGAWVLK